MDSGLAWPVSSETSSGSKSSRSAWMTVLRPLKFVNLPSMEATDAILCICFANVFIPIGTISHLVPDIGFWAVSWTQVEISRNIITLRTMANVFDKCSVRISLSTIRPPNLVVILSRPFCRSRFVSLAVLGSLYSMYYSVSVKSLS